MTNLITLSKTTFDGKLIDSVNARLIHEFLESKQDFSTWIKSRIEQFGFEENHDFVRLHKKMEGNNATLIDYFVSIDMAKELSMIERNEKGKQARKYFIECEKKLINAPLFNIPQTLSEALQLASDQAKQLEEQAPKVEYFEAVAKNETHMNATQVGHKFGMSAKVLNQHLMDLGIYNKNIKRTKTFKQSFLDKGYGEMKTTDNGFSQAVFTVKGEQYLHELLTSEGII